MVATNENGYLVDGMDVSYTGPTLGITVLYFNPYVRAAELSDVQPGS
jgi:hypothetical protein